VKPARRLMDMTQGEVDAEVEFEHERRLARFEREQDIAQNRDDRREAWLESLEPEDEAA
jgi:hypothetical protein